MAALRGALLQSFAGDAEVGAFFTDQAEIDGILRFEAELAGAQADCGLIPEAAANAVADACRRFAPDWNALAAGLARDGVVVPALVRGLRILAGEEFAHAVHLGATSQDAMDSSLVLRLVGVMSILHARIDALLAGFAGLADAAEGRRTMAHTRMQRALPMAWGQRIENWSAPLAQLRDGLARLKPRLAVIQLGGPVGDRRDLGGKGAAVAAKLAQRLSLGNARAWHTDRGTLVELGGLLAGLAGALGKFGMDVALLSQNEVAALSLAAGGGSSSMAHKSNPVKAELLVALARRSAGLAGTMHHASIHEYERSGSAWTLEWLTLPDLVLSAAASSRIAQSLLTEVQLPKAMELLWPTL